MTISDMGVQAKPFMLCGYSMLGDMMPGELTKDPFMSDDPCCAMGGEPLEALELDADSGVLPFIFSYSSTENLRSKSAPPIDMCIWLGGWAMPALPKPSKMSMLARFEFSGAFCSIGLV